MTSIKSRLGMGGGRATQKTWTRAKVLKKLRTIGMWTFRYILIICLMYMILYPLLRMVANAIVHPHHINAVGSFWIPARMSFDNFIVAWHVMNFIPVLLFTMLFITIMMLLQLANAAFAGYAFARLRFWGSSIIFVLVLLTVVVPTQAFFFPQFIMFRNFDVFGIFNLVLGGPINLLGRPAAMYLMAGLGQGLAGGIFIYIFRQFFRGLPKELEEAAYVDGAGVLRTFFTIVIPMAKPAFLTVGTLSFIWNWNDSWFQSVFHPYDMYMRVRIATLNAPGGGGVSRMQANIDMIRGRLPDDIYVLTTLPYDNVILSVANLLSILPLVLLFLIIQRQFVQGVERSGIVG